MLQDFNRAAALDNKRIKRRVSHDTLFYNTISPFELEFGVFYLSFCRTLFSSDITIKKY